MKIIVMKDAADSLPRISGVRFLHFPAIQIRKLKVKWPSQVFDALLITSAHAVSKSQLKRIHCKEIFVIGKKTRAKVGKGRVIQPSHSQGILKHFRKWKKAHPGGSILFPRSRRADPETIRGLRSLGLRVRVLNTYSTEILSLPKAFSRLLKSGNVDAVFVSSGSIWSALKKSQGLKALRKLNVPFVAIGPQTSKLLRIDRVSHFVAKRPSLLEMVKILRKSRFR